MLENKDVLNKKFKVSTRIVTDNGIGELFPVGNIHQEIYNQIIPPFGTQGQLKYEYHRIPSIPAATAGSKSVNRSKPPNDITGCHCDESLRRLCEGKNGCPCSTSQSDKRPPSQQRQKIQMPKFIMAPLRETSGRRSSGGGSGGGTSQQTNVNNSSNGGGGAGLSPNESSIGSKFYPGGERGERKSKDNGESNGRRRSSRDDGSCENFPPSNRETKTSSITRQSDHMNRNSWNYTSQRKMPTRNTITVSYDTHQTSEGSCCEEAATRTNTLECRSVRVNSDQCSNTCRRSQNESLCAPVHRLSAELTPVISTSTGCQQRRKSTRESTKNPSHSMRMRRASDEDNRNDVSKTSSQVPRNNELGFDTLFHDRQLVQQNAGDAVQSGQRNSQKCINCSSMSVPPLSYFLIIIIAWLVVLSCAVYALLEKRKVYDGIYP